MRIYDEDEIAELEAEQWMLDLLRLNPDYVFWGPHEDYMTGRSQNSLDCPIVLGSWKEFDVELDSYNECVNFYFSVSRPQIDCTDCGCTGHNPATKEIADAFYAHDGDRDRRWCNKITQDEADCLVEHGRLSELYSDHQHWVRCQKGEEARPRILAEDVNARKPDCHDAINRWILVECRARRMGVWGSCEKCGGRGIINTGPARVSLTLWILYPRKGCSRGVEVTTIEREELTSVFAFLAEAAERNQSRFAAVVAASKEA